MNWPISTPTLKLTRLVNSPSNFMTTSKASVVVMTFQVTQSLSTQPSPPVSGTPIEVR